jgi:hypothetical protein
MNNGKLSILCFIITISSAFADEWVPADKYREAAFMTLHTVDWLQTRTISKHEYYYEQNIYLGKHPSTGKVDKYFAATAIAHYLIADRLSPEWRKAFQYVSIGISGGAVLNNVSLGIRMDL